MKVLVACEESQRVCLEFRSRGHEAYSCDAHPPCTYLSNVATRHHSKKMTTENRIEGRTIQRIQAMDFFMRCIQVPCSKIAVENPVGIMNTAFRCRRIRSSNLSSSRRVRKTRRTM